MSKKSSDIVISVKNVSKKFRIPHEKINTIRGVFVNLFSKKRYDEFHALHAVNFDVQKGEFIGIIGRNGSGKSTLLKILAGIYQPDRGAVLVYGDISPFLELGIGFNPDLSGRDNIYLNGSVLGMSQKEIQKKFNEIVAFSELERFIDQKLKNYSSGMQVRLAFSVAIHANSDILLMDEVLAVGDSNFQAKCFEEFMRYKQEGRTVILVTHDVSIIQKYCDRAILLREGKIITIGKAEDVGNEYIYQNMSDEEKRIIKEQDQEKIRAELEKMNTEKSIEKLKGRERKEQMKKMGDEKRNQEDPKRNKVAEINKVEFLDKEGEVKNVFQTGDDLSVRVYFKTKKACPILNFGIAIFDQTQNYIFGINTILDHVNVEKYIEKQYFQVHYSHILLKTNTYYVKVGIFGEDDHKVYDFLDQSNIFKVYSTNKNQGAFELTYTWK